MSAIVGPPGTGKTYQACEIAKACVKGNVSDGSRLRILWGAWTRAAVFNLYKAAMKAGISPSSCIIVDKKLPLDLQSATSLTLEGRNYQQWQDLIRTRKVLHVFVTLGKTHAPPVHFSSVLELWQYLFDLGLLDEGGQVLEIFGKHMSMVLSGGSILRAITCNMVLRVFRPTCRNPAGCGPTSLYLKQPVCLGDPSKQLSGSSSVTVVTSPSCLSWILFPEGHGAVIVI